MQNDLLSFEKLCLKFQITFKKKSTFCTFFIEHLKNEVNDLISTHKELLVRKQSRKRRSLGNWLGEGFNLVFGLMSDSDRERIKGEMNAVKKNQHDELAIHKNDLTIIDRSFNKLNSTIVAFNQQLSTYQIFIQDLKNVEAVQNEDQMEKIINLFIIEFNSKLAKVDKSLRKLRRWINDLTQGHFTPEILSMDVVVENLRTKKLPSDNMFITDFYEPNIQQFMNLVDVLVFGHKNELIIMTDIPIVKKKAMEMFKFINVPFINGSIMTMLKLPEEYVLTSRHKEKLAYTFLKSFDNCKTYNGTYYCKNLNHFHKQSQSCVLQILNNSKNFSLCERIHIKNSGEHLIVQETSFPNTFIVSSPKEIEGWIYANDTEKPIRLKGNQLIHTNQRMTLSFEDFELEFEDTDGTSAEINEKFFELQDINLTIPKMDLLYDLSHLDNIPLPSKLSTKDINEMSADIKTNIQKTENLKTLVAFQSANDEIQWIVYIAIIAGSVLVGIVVSLVIVLIVLHKMNKNRTTRGMDNLTLQMNTLERVTFPSTRPSAPACILD